MESRNWSRFEMFVSHPYFERHSNIETSLQAVVNQMRGVDINKLPPGFRVVSLAESETGAFLPQDFGRENVLILNPCLESFAIAEATTAIARQMAAVVLGINQKPFGMLTAEQERAIADLLEVWGISGMPAPLSHTAGSAA